MNPAFASQAFWQPYFTLESGDETELSQQLDDLSRDYDVAERTFTFEVSGQPHTASSRAVVFPFSCGDRFSLEIEYQPDVNGGEKSLSLVDLRSGARHQMGWWDLARWHPYCLRLEELDSLLRHWQGQDPRWPDPDLPLLLLCQFVGLPDETSRELLKARVEAALRTVAGPDACEIPDDALTVLDDYRWEEDAELGWVFTSDDYCCYSLRNRPHAGSDEGTFPFPEFRELLAATR